MLSIDLLENSIYYFENTLRFYANPKPPLPLLF